MRINLSDQTDEAILVKRCKNEDPTAQRILYHKYVEDMMVLCLRYIPGEEDAKEALMDGFLRFFGKIDTFAYRGEGSVKAWLKTIVINSCLMHLRKRTDEFVPLTEQHEYETTEADDQTLSNLAAKDILKLLHGLPDGYRTVFNMYCFDGLNHREIGELLGISENTSKSQLHRARALLKEQILLRN